MLNRKGATYVVVADAHRAELYRRGKRRGPLELVGKLSDEAARNREQDLVSDRPGRAFDSAGHGRHAMEPATTEKRHQREAFARRIADELDAARNAGRFTKLVIVAAPAMLGELRARLDHATADCVIAEFDKDLAGQDPDAVTKLIDA